MKKVILLLLFMHSCIIAFCQSYSIGMTPIGYDNNPIGNKSPIVIPSVEYDNESINIFFTSSIDYLQVIIRDEDGNIIYNNVVAFVPPSLMLTLSDAVDENKYSIELIYDSIHLIGYF